jgi:imidazolonepropionase-like amidohydrolase/Tol biopolymer transport system component
MKTSTVPVLVTFLLACMLIVPAAAARTIEFETTEVTQADVTLSPDGQWLIFTMLGHLFRLPVEGGTGEQLTFGPYYDSDPVFSPDGARVAFVSDRDGSSGNVFVLELATGQITQVTHEAWAGRPTWTPDGEGIVYLSYVFEAQPEGGWGSRWLNWFRRIFPALIRRIALSGAEPETLSAPLRLFRSVFYLPDGRLAWTVIESKTGSPRWTTRIEVMSAQGTVSILRTLEGVADRVVASATGEGFYCRCYVPLMYYSLTQKDDILFLPLPTGAERQILAVSGLWYSSPRFAVATDDKTLYVGNSGRLWEVTLPGGARKPLAFSARVRLEIHDPVAPPKWAAPAVGNSAPPRSVRSPRLSPDGRTLVFRAARYVWRQPLDGGGAQRLSEENAVEYYPAFSPDGRQLAFRSFRQGKYELKVLSFETQQTRTLAFGFFEQLSWSPDGKRLVFAHDGHRLAAINVGDGRIEELFEAGDWEPYPHFSADGQSVYFTADGTLYRLQLKEKAKPEPITQLARPLADGRVSPDGKWLAFRRKIEIWVAALSKEPVREEDVRQLSPEADSFAFTPDSSALVYSVGNRVWRHPLAGGEREEIPIRLELPRPTPPPLLLRRVRVLDFAAGGFGRETSLYIEQGRIRWIGSERGRRLPQATVVVDVGGRFALPGLFDMHVHTGFLAQAAMLAYGVTSVRNVGGGLPGLNSLADRGDATSDPMARQFYSGQMYRGPHPEVSGQARARIESEDDARAYVRRWKERGVHFVKTHPPITWQLRRAVAQEARRLGLPVVGHGLGLTEVTQSATLGYASVEHASNRFYDDVLQMLALTGTRWCPTLAVGGGNHLLLRNEPERLADEKFHAFHSENRRARQKLDRFKFLSDTAIRGRSVEQLATVRAAHRHGVRLLAGTDAPAAFSGVSLHWELEYFVQAGIPPLDVLRIATQEAAAAVGAEDELGTLEPGKLADLVLLDANPLEDIKNTQTIWRVIKGGWLFDPEKLRPPASILATK